MTQKFCLGVCVPSLTYDRILIAVLFIQVKNGKQLEAEWMGEWINQCGCVCGIYQGDMMAFCNNRNMSEPCNDQKHSGTARACCVTLLYEVLREAKAAEIGRH